MILYPDDLDNTSNLQNECLKIKEKTKKGYSGAQRINRLQKIFELKGSFNQTSRVYSDNGLCPTIDTMGGGGREPKIAVEYEPNTCLIQPKDRDYKSKGAERETHIEIKNDGVSHTLRTGNQTLCAETPLRIRKLTPLECWRLMGFDNEDFYKAKSTGMSDTQLYKQAGNSIVVYVIEEIYRCIFGLC